jgi:hypothetical protein
MQPEIWIGTIEISYTEPEKPNSTKRAFSVVTTWASSVEEFRHKCDLMLESHGWTLLGIEAANPVPPDAAFGDEMEDMLERTRADEAATIYGTFHTYTLM